LDNKAPAQFDTDASCEALLVIFVIGPVRSSAAANVENISLPMGMKANKKFQLKWEA